MLRICAATLMLLFIAGCTQSTESVDTSSPNSETASAEVPTPAGTDSTDVADAMIDLANTTEVVVSVPGMH